MAAEVADRARGRALTSGPVRVTLPARIAYDPGALKESIGSIMERIGCPKCFSGADCLFRMERSLVVDEKGRADPEPDPWADHHIRPFEAKHQVTVAMATEVKHDINRVFEAIDRVIDVIGPHPCISGFDTLFKDEMIVVNPALETQRF